MALQQERFGHDVEQAPGELAGLIEAVETALQDDELVAAEPRQHVAAAETAREPAGGGLQQRIAGLVTEGIVDQLEPIEVEAEQRQGAAVLELQQGLTQAVTQQAAVRQTRQGIVRRQMVDAGLGPDLLRDVLVGGDVAAGRDRAVGDVDGAAILEHGERPRRDAGADALLIVVDRVAPGRASEVRDAGERCLLADEGLGQAVELRVGRVAQDQARPVVEHRQPMRHVVERRLEAIDELVDRSRHAAGQHQRDQRQHDRDNEADQDDRDDHPLHRSEHRPGAFGRHHGPAELIRGQRGRRPDPVLAGQPAAALPVGAPSGQVDRTHKPFAGHAQPRMGSQQAILADQQGLAAAAQSLGRGQHLVETGARGLEQQHPDEIRRRSELLVDRSAGERDRVTGRSIILEVADQRRAGGTVLQPGKEVGHQLEDRGIGAHVADEIASLGDRVDDVPVAVDEHDVVVAVFRRETAEQGMDRIVGLAVEIGETAAVGGLCGGAGRIFDRKARPLLGRQELEADGELVQHVLDGRVVGRAEQVVAGGLELERDRVPLGGRDVDQMIADQLLGRARRHQACGQARHGRHADRGQHDQDRELDRQPEVRELENRQDLGS